MSQADAGLTPQTKGIKGHHVGFPLFTRNDPPRCPFPAPAFMKSFDGNILHPQSVPFYNIMHLLHKGIEEPPLCAGQPRQKRTRLFWNARNLTGADVTMINMCLQWKCVVKSASADTDAFHDK